MDNVDRLRSITSDSHSDDDIPTPPPSSSPTPRSRCWTWFCLHACSHAGLAILVVAYTLLGAVIFEFVEGGQENIMATSSGVYRSSNEVKQQMNNHVGSVRSRAGLEETHLQKSREDCLRELWTITERLNVLYERNWTRLVHEQLRKFEHNLIAASQASGYTGGGNHLSGEYDLLGNDHHHHHHQHWSFGGALLYSVTVITTIGYGNLSPRTALGKILTMIYAAFGVPLMLLCLSSMGQLLARVVHYVYMRLTCRNHHHHTNSATSSAHQRTSRSPGSGGGPALDNKGYSHKYQMAPTSPGRMSCASTHDTSLIQLSTPHKVPNITPTHSHSHSHSPHHSQHLVHHVQNQQLPHTPRKSALATVNSSHTRGRCRLLSTERTSGVPRPPLLPECSTHVPIRGEDIADPDETDDAESGNFPHDTPSRIPLIWRGSGGEDDTKSTTSVVNRSGRQNAGDHHQTTSVPIIIVFLVLSAYLCLGAFVFSAWENWSFLDATYFCFITLSTIGFGDLVPGKTFPSAEDYGHLQLVLCSAYLVLGLVLVAMSFSLIHEEVISKCKQFARYVGGHSH